MDAVQQNGKTMTLKFELVDAPKNLPAISGENFRHQIEESILEFFCATISNKNTRRTYMSGIKSLVDFGETKMSIKLVDMRPMHIAAWVEDSTRINAITTVRAQLSAVKMLFSYLVVKGLIESSPAHHIKSPRFSREIGTTPIMSAEEAKRLLASIETTTIKGLRDRALIAVSLLTFARVNALIGIKRKDIIHESGRTFILLFEKGSKSRRIPMSSLLHDFLEPYLAHACNGIDASVEDHLFRSMASSGRNAPLTRKPLSQRDVWDIIQKRANKIGLYGLSPHSMRGTGITSFLNNGGQLEIARQMAGHSDVKTTMLYDRRGSRDLQSAFEKVL